MIGRAYKPIPRSCPCRDLILKYLPTYGFIVLRMDITRSTVFDEEIGYKIRDFINDIISNKIAELEKEFKSL